jgi:hypothetical protein
MTIPLNTPPVVALSIITDNRGDLKQASVCDAAGRVSTRSVKDVGSPPLKDGEALLRRLLSALKENVYLNIDIDSLPYILTGWRLSTHIWPTITNLAMRYKIALPFTDMVKCGGTRWYKTKNMLDLDVVYGISFEDKDTEVDSALRFWGFSPRNEVDRVRDTRTAAIRYMNACTDPS